MVQVNFDTYRFVQDLVSRLENGGDSSHASAKAFDSTKAVGFSAVKAGAAGNGLTVKIVNPAGNNAGVTYTLSGDNRTLTIELSKAGGTLVANDNKAVTIVSAINANAVVNKIFHANLRGTGAGSLDTTTTLVLAGGRNGSTFTRPLAAHELAGAFKVIQDLVSSGEITGTGGTLTSVTKVATFVADSQVGNEVVFLGNTTAALAGVTARVISNTTGALYFDRTLPAAPQNGDKFGIRGAFLDSAIDAILQGKKVPTSPPGHPYGDARVVYDALIRGVRLFGEVLLGDTSVFAGSTTAGSTTKRVMLNTRGGKFRPGQFVGMYVTVQGYPMHEIVNSDENSVTISGLYSSAPADSLNVKITDELMGRGVADASFVPGGASAGQHVLFAAFLQKLVSLIEAFTIPV